MSRLKTNVAVGLFVLVGIGILAFFTLRVGKGGFRQDLPVRFKTTFTNAIGVAPGTPVEVAGVKVGEVESVTLDGNRATVWLRLRAGVELPPGTEAKIKTQGLLGDTYVALVPGRAPGAPLGSGTDLGQGRSPVEVDELIESLTAVGDDIKAITGTLKNAVASKETEESLVEIVRSVRDLTARLQEIVASNEERFDRLMENAEKLSGEASGVVADNRADIRALVENLKGVSETLNKVLASRQGDLEQTIATIREASQKLDDSMTSVKSITGKIDKGEGTLGKLVNENKIADSTGDVLEGAGKLLSFPDKLVTTFGFRFEYLTHAGNFKSYFGLKIQPRLDRFYLLEAVANPLQRVRTSTTTEKTVIEGNPPFTTGDPPYIYTTKTTKDYGEVPAFLFSAEIGQRFDRFVVRGGLIESTGGFGADVFFAEDKLKFSLEAFDFASEDPERPNPNFKFQGLWTFYPRLYLMAGIDDLLNNPNAHDSGREAFVGAGFEFTDDDLKNMLLKVPIPGL